MKESQIKKEPLLQIYKAYKKGEFIYWAL